MLPEKLDLILQFLFINTGEFYEFEIEVVTFCDFFDDMKSKAVPELRLCYLF